MKKILCILMSVLILFGSLGAVCVAAADGEEVYSEQEVEAAVNAMQYFKVKGLPESFDCDIDGLRTLEGGKYWESINLMGIDLEFLYDSTSPLVWGVLDVYRKDADGNFVLDPAGKPIPLITKGEIALTLSSINAYLKKIFYDAYGGLKLYTVKNAIGLANAIGNMFYRDFETLNADNFTNLFGNQNPSAKVFFEAVVELSGLDVLLQANWCPRGKAYCEPIVNALGGTYTNFFDEYYTDGKLLGARILEGMFAKMNIVGPVAVFLDAVKTFATSYNSVYREPIMALFTHKMEKIGYVDTVEKYNTFSGLLEIAFCNCDPIAHNDKDRGCFSSDPSIRAKVDHFCPLDLPLDRMLTADEDDFLMYLYYYLNLCGKHRGNAAYIEKVKRNIDKNTHFNSTAKARIKSIFNGYFLNDIMDTTNTLVDPYLSESFQPESSSLFDRLVNSISVFLKRIADYFDYLRKLFSGEINYGEGNSPFV